MRLVSVLLASVALGVGASPLPTSGTISFDVYELMLPGVFVMATPDNETESAAFNKAPTKELEAKEPNEPLAEAPETLEFNEHPKEAPEAKEADAPTDEYDGIDFDGDVAPMLFMDPDVVFAKADRKMEALSPASDDGSGVGQLFFFPEEGALDRVTTTRPKETPTTTTTTSRPPPEGGEGNGGFVFPSDISIDTDGGEETAPATGPFRSTRREGGCLLKYQVMFQGKCEQLLARNTCAEDEWLVLVEGAARCVRRPCPWGKIPFEGRCVDPTDLSVCDYGQIMYVSLGGEAVCDCDHGFLYDPRSGNCYAKHEKGSCGFGEFVDVSASGRVTCVRNPCLSDGYVKEMDSGLCYRKMYGGFCADLIFHRNNRTAECREIAAHNILDVPDLRDCPPGSIRDYLNVCRETFHMPTLTSYPMLYGGCPGGFIRDPTGTCRKTSRLFG